jgi:hypothetical protein
MIRLKDLKNEFKVIKSITLENAYNLYSNTRHGNRSVFLYLGYVKIKNGKVTHYPTGTITSDIKELHEIVNTWADNAKYDVITYSPDCRSSYVAEVRLHDFMASMGFEYDRNIYSLTMNKVAGNKDKLKIDITVKDKDNNEYEVVAMMLTGEYSWIDLSGKTYKEVMDNITSIMRAITLTTLANSFEIFNKTKDANMDLVNKMVMSKMSGPLSIEKMSFKEYLINTLEETLNNLKK